MTRFHSFIQHPDCFSQSKILNFEQDFSLDPDFPRIAIRHENTKSAPPPPRLGDVNK